jgi:hypothetical protein
MRSHLDFGLTIWDWRLEFLASVVCVLTGLLRRKRPVKTQDEEID